MKTAIEKGHSAGWAEGLVEGMEKGREEGLVEGEAIGMEKGREEGLVEGMEKGRSEMIRTLYNNGLSVEQIEAFCGLSQEQIREIIKPEK
jgi:predicted transposase YdaD